MTNTSLRRWSWIHKWSSLVCTTFMLLLCLTGLPLIFHHEIQELTGTAVPARHHPPGAQRASLDTVLATAQARHPGLFPMYVSREEDDDSFWYVSLAPRLEETEKFEVLAIDAYTAQVLPSPDFYSGFMYWMTRLHVDLFAGLPGMLFLGAMGLLLLAALVSGVVLYAPFMGKLPFGAVRRGRSARLRWLDLHNALGICTLAWLFVVGATGVVNTLAQPALNYWQEHHLKPWLSRHAGGRPPTAAERSPLDAAVRAAMATEPGMTLSYLAFPGVLAGTPMHYTIYMRGSSALTAKLYQPVLVNARSGAVEGSVAPPWYLKTLYLSQPLHFGDYAGMPLKLLWAVLDVLCIAVLGSGLYLWLRKPAMRPAAIAAAARKAAA